MKLGTVKTNDFATNSELHGNYRVANNAAMQKILSDSLYQNKPKSVIREICCNALDAHFEAGISDKPIKVTFPTSLDPTFSVRDFGTGLSLEELTELYTVYGISTKRGSDDAIGGFGIGSKSPFCYTKMWNVISRHNGMKYVVCNSMDSKERFCFDVLHQEECDEPSGIEVRFDVDRKDFETFTSNAKEVFKYFNVTPETNINLNIEKPKYELKTPEYGILSYTNAYSYVKNQVIVGQVAYPLDSAPFKGNARIILDNCSLHIFCKIKDIQVSPSRESISHEAHNIAHITAILEDAYKKIKEETDNKVKGCKNLWEARLFANKYFGSSSYIGRILNYEMDFNGSKVKQQNSISPKIVDKDGKQVRIQPVEYTAKRDYYSKKLEGVHEQKKHVCIDVKESVKFAIYETGGYAAAKRYVEQNPDVNLYVFEPEYKEYITKELGYPEADLLYTSSFPAAVRQARAKSNKNKIQAYKYRNGATFSYYNDHPRNYWTDAEVDIDVETGYYAPIRAFHIDGIPPSVIISVPVGVNILGILEKREEKVKNHANWKHIKEYFREKLDKLSLNPAVQKYSNVTGYSDNLKRLSGIYGKLKNKNTPFAQMLAQVIDYDKHKGGVEEFYETKKTFERLSGETYVVKNSQKIDLNFDFLKTYPLLKYVNSAYYTSDEVVDYINQIS